MKSFIKKPNNRTSFFIFYEILMVSVSLAIVLLSIIDLFVSFNTPTSLVIRRVDYIICIIFALDLILNLYISKDKIKCLKSSAITVLAVVPFSTFFRIAGVLRFSKLFSLFKYTTPSNIGIFSRLWVFFMQPSVIRISKFSNMARSYSTNPEKKSSKIKTQNTKYNRGNNIN